MPIANCFVMADLDIIVAVIICLLSITLGVYQMYANYKHPALASFSTRVLPLCLLMIAVKIMIWGLSGIGLSVLPAMLVIDLFPLIVLASSFLPKVKWVVFLALGVGLLFEVVCILLKHLTNAVFDPLICNAITVMCALFYLAYYLCELWTYIYRIRNIVKKTTIWTMLSLSVDFVYVMSVVANVVLLYVGHVLFLRLSAVFSLLSALLLVLTLVALAYRISSDSLFFVMRCHETIILETINDAPTDVSSAASTVDDTYREIYGRVVDYFETDTPYLSGDLVIEDLVKVVYANKLYISRAISRCAGRNFCQFVNYYRIKHSVEVFRRNPELKVAELACQSGFNSVPSFTMAFKLYMDENPSDWIRRERNRLSKSKIERMI